MNPFEQFYTTLENLNLCIPEVMEYEALRTANLIREMEDDEVMAFLLDGGCDYLTKSDLIFVEEFIWRCEVDEIEISQRLGEVKSRGFLAAVDKEIRKEIRNEKKTHHHGHPDARQS